MPPEPSVIGRIAVSSQDPSCDGAAADLAASLSLPLAGPGAADADLLLAVAPGGLSLRLAEPGPAGPGPVRIEIDTLDWSALTAAGSRQPLARAIGLGSGPPPTVLDATAGLLGDAIHLAALGCRVHAVERHPVMHALHIGALGRLRAHRDGRCAALADRIDTICADTSVLLRDPEALARLAPDVIYLDPMHPPRRKSALVGKEMRILRMLVGDDPDWPDLLGAALVAGPRRVVLKQPRHAPPAPGAPRRVHSHAGRSVRYDVFRASGPG